MEKNFGFYFAIFWSIIASLFIFLIVMTDIPEANQRFADTILGFLMGSVIAPILGFYFGSSKSSEIKTEMLNEIAQK